ncbi:hypothetical protein OUZ56_000296 [Daphnia magna]|uniref:Uncharacterized protein n=1 Tax=Daphnia magna TaxID=35525 RepID=A0ABQ9ZZ91_9CRUS|nr:hypothetical protein OUZ56_000296 [Daphnia magna]
MAFAALGKVKVTIPALLSITGDAGYSQTAEEEEQEGARVLLDHKSTQPSKLTKDVEGLENPHHPRAIRMPKALFACVYVPLNVLCRRVSRADSSSNRRDGTTENLRIYFFRLSQDEPSSADEEKKKRKRKIQIQPVETLNQLSVDL